MLFAYGNIPRSSLVQGMIRMALDQNTLHEYNKGLQGTFTHLHGWGFAHQTGDGWGIYRSSLPISADESLNRIQRTRDAIIIHARRATRGGVKTANSHPFIGFAKNKQWVFCHNGTLNHTSLMTPLFTYGTTDSETFFNKLLFELETKTVQGALLSAFNSVPYYTAINFFLTTDDMAYAHVGYTKHPDYYTMHKARVNGGLIISSEPLKEISNSWSRIDNNTLISIDLSNGSTCVTHLNKPHIT